MVSETYKARCHCGGIKFFFKTQILPNKWAIRVCDCLFCSERIGHLYCADPEGSVRFYFEGLNRVQQSWHGTNTAAFIECTECYSFMGAVMKNKTSHLAVLNIQHLAAKISLPEPYKLSWGGENTKARLARRFKTWTPVCGDMLNLES